MGLQKGNRGAWKDAGLKCKAQLEHLKREEEGGEIAKLGGGGRKVGFPKEGREKKKLPEKTKKRALDLAHFSWRRRGRGGREAAQVKSDLPTNLLSTRGRGQGKQQKKNGISWEKTRGVIRGGGERGAGR